MIEPGTELCLTYPTQTDILHIDKCQRRQRIVLARRIRDLVFEPLTVAEYSRRPYTYRSRYLITGIDKHLGDWRNFYLGSSDEYRSSGYLRLVRYDPNRQRIVDYFAGQYAPSPKDRRHLLRLAIELSEDRMRHGLEIRITADDLRLIQSAG